MQKRILVILAQVLIVMSVMGVLTGVHAEEGVSPAKGVPSAFVEKLEYDFGSTMEGSDVIHDFMIQNKGDADLEIISVRSG